MSDITGEGYSKKEKNIMRFLPKQQNDRHKRERGRKKERERKLRKQLEVHGKISVSMQLQIGKRNLEN